MFAFRHYRIHQLLSRQFMHLSYKAITLRRIDAYSLNLSADRLYNKLNRMHHLYIVINPVKMLEMKYGDR